MNDTTILNYLKVNLGITSTAYDTRLTDLIASAKAMITREGITLNTAGSFEDAQIVIMYAAWLWGKRDSDGAMPRMLRWALNNRVFSERGAV